MLKENKQNSLKLVKMQKKIIKDKKKIQEK